MNRPVTSTKTETVIKQLRTHKSAGPDGFTGICQTFREELMPMLLKFPKTRQRNEHAQSFCEATITLILIAKADRATQQEKITGQYHW